MSSEIVERHVIFPPHWEKYREEVPESMLEEWGGQDLNNLVGSPLMFCECKEYSLEKYGHTRVYRIHFGGDISGDDFIATCLGGAIASDPIGLMVALTYVVGMCKEYNDEASEDDIFLLPVDAHFVDGDPKWVVKAKAFPLRRSRFVEVLGIFLSHRGTMKAMLSCLKDERVYVRQMSALFIRGMCVG